MPSVEHVECIKYITFSDTVLKWSTDEHSAVNIFMHSSACMHRTRNIFHLKKLTINFEKFSYMRARLDLDYSMNNKANFMLINRCNASPINASITIVHISIYTAVLLWCAMMWARGCKCNTPCLLLLHKTHMI